MERLALCAKLPRTVRRSGTQEHSANAERARCLCGGIAEHRRNGVQVAGAASGCGRVSDPGAGLALTMSSYAQCLFGLDVSSIAMMRYRMLPLAGWEIV